MHLLLKERTTSILHVQLVIFVDSVDDHVHVLSFRKNSSISMYIFDLYIFITQDLNGLSFYKHILIFTQSKINNGLG